MESFCPVVLCVKLGYQRVGSLVLIELQGERGGIYEKIIIIHVIIICITI